MIYLSALSRSDVAHRSLGLISRLSIPIQGFSICQTSCDPAKFEAIRRVIGWMVTSFLLIDYSNMLGFYSDYIYIYYLVVCPLLYTMAGSSFKSLLPYPTRPFQICKVFQSTTGWRELITFSSSTRSFHVHSTHGCEFHQARNTRLWWSMRPSESRHQPPSKGAWESDQSGKSLWKLRILMLEKTFMLSCHVCPD